MLKAGITGGIGSGKSYICKIFSSLQIPVYDADSQAAKLLGSNDIIKSELIKLFGHGLYKDHKFDRKKLSDIIFSDAGILKKVNSIIHPAVALDFEAWVNKHSDSPYVIKEAAILFESGANKGLDYTINVNCPEKIRIERVMKRDNIPAEKVISIIKNQYTDETRNNLADFTITNDENSEVLKEVLKLHDFFLTHRTIKA